MSTTRKSIQDLISSEIRAKLSNIEDNMDWTRQWLEFAKGSVADRGLLRDLFEQRLLPLFTAPTARVERVCGRGLLIHRVVFRISALYQELSDCRQLRLRLLAGEHLACFEGSDFSVDEQLEILEVEMHCVKQITMYLAAVDPTAPSTVIALGGDPNVSCMEQDLTMYLLRSAEDPTFWYFSDLSAQCWMQDLYLLSDFLREGRCLHDLVSWASHDFRQVTDDDDNEKEDIFI